MLALGALAMTGLAGVPAAGRPAPTSKAAPRNWSTVVAATPEGGFRMGNPAAAIKLVEYASLTCSHCATFAREGTPSLVAKYVKTGKVSYEYRSYILNGIDVAAVLATRCSGAKGFFPMAEALYANQPQWLGKVSILT